MNTLALPCRPLNPINGRPRLLIQPNLDAIVEDVLDVQLENFFDTAEPAEPMAKNNEPQTKIDLIKSQATVALLSGEIALKAAKNGRSAEIINDTKSTLRLGARPDYIFAEHPTYLPTLEPALTKKLLVVAATIGVALGYNEVSVAPQVWGIRDGDPAELGLSRKNFCGIGYGNYKMPL